MKGTKFTRTYLVAGAIAFGLVLAGCDKSTDAVNEPVLEEDAAYAVAGALSEDGGGAADQISDAASLTTSGGMQANGAGFDGEFRALGSATVDTSYNDVTGWWTASITRSRSSVGGLNVSQFSRVYEYQFLNSGGTPQRRYIVGPDTAYSIHFIIVSGSGYHRTPVRVNRLDSLHGDWMVTNTQTPIVTINGTYYRQGSDTIKTRNATRTHNNTLNMTFTNVQKIRPISGGGMSGTISGTYVATITFTTDELYRERNIDKTFTIELSGDNANIRVGGRPFTFGWRMGGKL